MRGLIYRARATLRDGAGMLIPLPVLRALLSSGSVSPEATGAAGAAAAGLAGGGGVALKAGTTLGVAVCRRLGHRDPAPRRQAGRGVGGGPQPARPFRAGARRCRFELARAAARARSAAREAAIRNQALDARAAGTDEGSGSSGPGPASGSKGSSPGEGRGRGRQRAWRARAGGDDGGGGETSGGDDSDSSGHGSGGDDGGGTITDDSGHGGSSGSGGDDGVSSGLEVAPAGSGSGSDDGGSSGSGSSGSGSDDSGSECQRWRYNETTTTTTDRRPERAGPAEAAERPPRDLCAPRGFQ